MSQVKDNEQVVEAVRQRYAAAAAQAQSKQRSSCCSGGRSCGGVSEGIYDPAMLQEVPNGAALASLGCGNPIMLAELHPGEVVLDLGSGGGIDVLLSAKRVSPGGKAYGLDMTDEMLELARANSREAGVANVEFLKGRLESIPLPEGSVDVIISNCVINLSTDKDAVLREAFRVLKPGGRFAVSDIVVQGGSLPESVRQLMPLWTGCIAGALEEGEFRQKLVDVGFTDVDIQATKTYGLDDLPEELAKLASPDMLPASRPQVVSAFIRARRP